MKYFSSANRDNYVMALTPHLLARQSFIAKFSDYRSARIVKGELVMNPPFAQYEDITRRFLYLIRPAVRSVRAFRRHPPSPRYRAYQYLLSKRGRTLVADHSKDDLFDASFVFTAIGDTGLEFVYSFDSRQVDLPTLFSLIWNPAVLTNPATVIGATAVRYAKSGPNDSSTLRFVMLRGGFEAPDILVYAPKNRIIELFGLAVERAKFDRFHIRDITKNYQNLNTDRPSRYHKSPHITAK